MANSHILVGASTNPLQPVVRRISTSDLYYALARGYDDLAAFPSYAVFLCVIYPLLGILVDRPHLGKFAGVAAAGVPNGRWFHFGRAACRPRPL